MLPGRDMRKSHAHMEVTQREFDIVTTKIKPSPYHLNLPKRDFGEFMAIIESDRRMVLYRQRQPGARLWADVPIAERQARH